MPAGAAEESCSVEIDYCGEKNREAGPVRGGVRWIHMIRFNPDDSVILEPIICRKNLVQELQSSIVSFYTGLTRSASGILANQSRQMEEDHHSQKAMLRMVQLAHHMRDELHNGNLAAFGEILHENWMLKRSLMAGISSSAVDHFYDCGRAAGATGGKLLGAGGGGFLMFYAPPERHEAIERALPELRKVELRFEPRGSRIIVVQ